MGSGRIRAEKAKHSKSGEDQANSVFSCSFPSCDVFRKHWRMADSALLGLPPIGHSWCRWPVWLPDGADVAVVGRDEALARRIRWHGLG
jgi:hypothetical protein